MDTLQARLAFLWGRLTDLDWLVTDTYSRLWWGYLLVTVVIALVIYRCRSGGFEGFRGWLLPASIYRSNSLGVDLKLAVFNRLISPFGVLIQGITLSSFSLAIAGEFPERTGETPGVGFYLGGGAFNLLGSNLRHSHIWWDWGPVDKILTSPAMHQVHHSRLKHHYDRNFGFTLTLWDQLLGTVYYPKANERVEFGIPEGDPHRSLRLALVEPFVQCWRRRPWREKLEDSGA